MFSIAQGTTLPSFLTTVKDIQLLIVSYRQQSYISSEFTIAFEYSEVEVLYGMKSNFTCIYWHIAPKACSTLLYFVILVIHLI